MQHLWNTLERFWMRYKYKPLINQDSDSEDIDTICTRLQCREITSALNFIFTLLRNGKFKESRLLKLRKYLYIAIERRCQRDWCPQQPAIGSLYRRLCFNGHVEPLIFQAAMLAGLCPGEVCAELPDGLIIWIDPGRVAFWIPGFPKWFLQYGSTVWVPGGSMSTIKTQWDMSFDVNQSPAVKALEGYV